MERPSDSPTISFSQDGVSRRQFINGAAGIAATLGLTLTDAAEAQEKREAGLKDARPVKAAFIGVGDQGFGTDLRAALTVPGVEMVAICDIYEPYLKRAANLIPGVETYKDYRKMLERKDIEAVLIATPLYLHGPMTVDALNAGKHVFCEKMMSQTIDDGKNMARAARDNKKVLQIGHQRRANVMYHHAWELVNKKNVLGKITHIRAQWNRNGSWRKELLPGMTDRQRNWRLYKEYSHGLMSELGTHQIHAVNWFLNSGPVAVTGMGGIDYYKDGRELFDNVMVVFEYPGGVKVNYTSLTTNQYDGYYEQFMGDMGTLIISEEKETGASYFREPKHAAEDWMKAAVGGAQVGKHKEVGLKLDPEATKKIQGKGVKVGEKEFSDGVNKKSSYVLEMEDFFNSIRTGSPVTCDWKEALSCTVAAVRANEAMTKKTRIEIPASDYSI